ncbi:unnamed protein product [Bursaphelenchus okinawaensis]|uniref:Uncharacterized protein n=1 Tax=Bursaphelenchus okinawaensis TaxID=465554 RepID=A0A811LDU7_9BILA|nr:unnamed protein product [Bursaphelenchus okinawaensis]CAG9120842.1 unnamed protein product [Bursaphelenchus okinawaensis]
MFVLVLFWFMNAFICASQSSDEFLQIKIHQSKCYCPEISLLPVCLSGLNCPKTKVIREPNIKQVCADRRLFCQAPPGEFVQIVAVLSRRTIYMTKWSLYSTSVIVHCIDGNFYNTNMYNLRHVQKYECRASKFGDSEKYINRKV